MFYKKFLPLLIFVLAVFMSLSVTSIYSQGTVKTVSTTKKTETIKGEVIGLNCYLQSGAKGEKHKECALSCAKAGGMLAILSSDGTIYVPVVSMGSNPDTQLMDYVAQQVEVTGKVDDKGNMKGIEISSIKKAE